MTTNPYDVETGAFEYNFDYVKIYKAQEVQEILAKKVDRLKDKLCRGLCNRNNWTCETCKDIESVFLRNK